MTWAPSFLGNSEHLYAKLVYSQAVFHPDQRPTFICLSTRLPGANKGGNAPSSSQPYMLSSYSSITEPKRFLGQQKALEGYHARQGCW